MNQTAIAAQIYNQGDNRISLDGSFKVRYYSSKDKGVDGDQSKAKFTFKGETRISELATGFARWEYNVKFNQAETMGSKKNTSRIAFAGVSFGKYGTFNYGRDYGILNDINGWTGAPVPVFGGLSYDGIDNFMTYRTNNIATYRNRDIFDLVDGLSFGLQVQGKNDGLNDPERGLGPRSNNPRGVAHQNGSGAGVSLVYALDNGISFGTSYANSNRTGQQRQDRQGDTAHGWNIGMKYDANKIYLAAMYADVHNIHYVGRTDGFAPKTQAVELLAQYQFNWGLRPSIGYTQGMSKSLKSQYGNKKNTTKFLDLATTYDLNKNLALMLEYKLNLLNKSEFTKANHISTDDIFVTMLNYRF